MTHDDLEVLADGLAPVIKEIRDTLQSRIDVLAAKIAALETRPAALKYVGVWAPRAYEQDEACTHSGGLWIARRATKATERPGDDSAGWQLAVKSGAGAR